MNAKMRHLMKTLLLAGSALVLSACTAPLLIGAGAVAGYTAIQEKGPATVVDDVRLKTFVKDRLTQQHYTNFASIGVSVLQGEVMLTGVVNNEEERNEVVNTVRAVPDVIMVFDELIVSDAYTAAQRAEDTWIGTQIKGRMTAAKGVYAVNYTVETVQGHVYVMGLANSQSELERVLHILRTTKGVTQVHNYIRLSEDATQE